MKYVEIEQPGQVSIKEMNKPRRREGEALLKLLYGGICGSDLNTYRGTLSYSKYPVIPGHEFAAEIVEVDENEYGLKKGMIVTGNPYFNCNTCYACRMGRVNCCTSNETMGVQRDGGFCQYITMPVERIYDGMGLSPERLALVEPFCISFHGVKRGQVKKGDTVLVLGAGTIGVFAAISALQMGAKVYICDVNEEKLVYAKQFGIDGVILNKGEAYFQEEVKRITSGDGFDVTIEAVGLPSTFQNCIDAVCYAGRVVVIGIAKNNLDFNHSVIQKKELNIYGSRNALKKDFEEVIQMLTENKVENIDRMITNMYDYEKVKDAFEDFSRNAGAMLKIMLKF
ncbi:MAG TPA: zinc-binding alcohol dehydrogenase family protein [Candidatus Pelethocola excrementipullorum]|nr:zinc-binding alcohol dehydrogenase family protein [Candidatus Pelethocola excrementipullorum]